MNIVFTFLTTVYFFISFFKRKIFIKNISENDLVLDIGSGDKPFWRADVIVDKYLTDDQQRHSGSMLYDKNKIFIEGDVENLPFKDKSFDFVICSHLLEHVENPDKAISEIVRVGKKGYIEVPFGIVDLLMPFPPHLWFCDYRDKTLVFYQKEKEKNFFIQQTETFGKQFFNNPLMQYLLAKNYTSIFVTLYWKNNLKYKVIRVRNPYRYRYNEKVKHTKGLSVKINFFIYKTIYEIMTRIFYKKKNIEIEKLLKRNKKL